jgi:hypothetical protein
LKTGVVVVGEVVFILDIVFLSLILLGRGITEENRCRTRNGRGIISIMGDLFSISKGRVIGAAKHD